MKVLVDREEPFVPCTRRVKISLKPGSLLSASRVDSFTFITRLGTRVTSSLSCLSVTMEMVESPVHAGVLLSART